MDRGELAQLVLLAGEPVLDGLEHGQLLVQVGQGKFGWLGVGRGQRRGAGPLEVVARSTRA
ncbi:MAG: hypothetical protein AB8C95_12765 [Phycisphaeraceae bacterium]